ncbi:MAG: OmpA family protein, partial [Hymenobacter sp.]|nr:OmpA family protein [Hymenobacter sp.]
AGAAGAAGNSMASATQSFGNTMSSAAREAVRDTGSAMQRPAAPARWPWLVLLLLGLGGLWYFMSGRTRTSATVAPVAVEAPANSAGSPATSAAATGRYDEASGNYIYETGSPAELKLTDGTMLSVGANSTESRLYNFLNDASVSVNETDKTQGWISLDRLYFATGKATLTAESQAQLGNLASILKAFPNAAIKLGGYTDNTGKAEANLTLSADRANTAMQALTGMGIAANRVQAEGYGQEHPLAGNDTPEGRARNRRIDVRVTRK